MTDIVGDMLADSAPYFIAICVVAVCAIITVGNVENRKW